MTLRLEFEADGKDELIAGVGYLGAGRCRCARGQLICRVLRAGEVGERTPVGFLSCVHKGGIDIESTESIAQTKRDVMAVTVELIDCLGAGGVDILASIAHVGFGSGGFQSISGTDGELGCDTEFSANAQFA